MTRTDRTLASYCSQVVCRYCDPTYEKWGGRYYEKGLRCALIEEDVKHGDRCQVWHLVIRLAQGD